MKNYSGNHLPLAVKDTEFINHYIRDYIFLDTIIVKEEDMLKKEYLTFDNCKFIKGIRFERIDNSNDIDVKGLSFGNCEFIEKFSLNEVFKDYDNKKIGELRFGECVFRDGFGHNEDVFKKLKFKSITINEAIGSDFNFSWNFEIDFLSLTNVCGNYEVFSSCNEISISFNDGLADFYKMLLEEKLYDKDWDSFLLEDKNFRINPDNINEISIYQFFDEKVLSSDAALMNIDLWVDLNSTKDAPGNVTVDGIYSKLSVYGNVNSLELSRIFAKTINLHSISSLEKIKLENVHALVDDSTFIISSSNFNKASFFNVDFKSFKYFSIYKSNIESSFFSQCTFNESIYSFDVDDMNRNDSHAKYESYKQLKSALLKSNNTPVALRMHSKMYSHFFRTKEASFWDKIILIFNRMSNKHGISWSRGVLFILLIGLLTFLLYKNFLSIDIFGFSKNLKYYLLFLNPTHSFDFMKDYKPDEWAYVIDFISRIFIGYGYYQTVQAFRKFGKL
jgi:hypothetical protein